MAVNTSSNKISYSGDGTTTAFAYNFKILEASHLNVYLAGVLQTSGYTVSGAGNDAGGSVVFGVAPAAGAAILFQRIVPLTQPVSTVDNQTILSSVLDTALDRMTMQVQQNAANIAGALLSPAIDPVLDMTLPAQAVRKNNYLYFDANGEPTVLPSVTSGYYYGSAAVDPTSRPDGSASIAGDLYFNTTTLNMRVYTGAGWQNGLASASLSLGSYTEIAASAKTTFTITGGYSTGATLVYLNGVLLYPSEYTATNGTTIVLASPCAVGDEFRSISYSTFSVANTFAKSSNLSDLVNPSAALTNLGLSAFVSGLMPLADATSFRTAIGALSSSTSFVNRQTFTSSGTWTKPANAQVVLVRVWGGGGGGGGGQTGAASSGKGGGAGGAGGAYFERWFYASQLASTVAVTVGAGGAGGGSNSAGSAGGTSSFDTTVVCSGGAGGGAGASNSAVQGGSAQNATGGSALTVLGGTTTTDAYYGGGGGGGGTNAGANSLAGGGGGGGGGGGESSTNFLQQPGAGGISATPSSGFGAAGTSNASAPVAGGAASRAGCGGGGGGSAQSVNGGNGGAGAFPGGGGGGGGSARNGFSGGTGGAGGAGYVEVYAW